MGVGVVKAKTPRQQISDHVSRQENGCWAWTGTRGRNGYGQVRVKGRLQYAHRVSYELATGTPLPGGVELDHLCRNRACVNPIHLEPVSKTENVRRGLSSFDGRELCKNNLHDITDPANVVRQGGFRRCRECRTAAERRRTQRVSAERAKARAARGEKPWRSALDSDYFNDDWEND